MTCVGRFWHIWYALVLSATVGFCRGECEHINNDQDACIRVSSTSPVTLGMSIWFTVKVYNFKLDPDETLFFSFHDGLFFSDQEQVSALDYTWNVTCDYDTYRPYTGRRTAKFKVYYKTFLFWREMDTADLEYTITDAINGGIVIMQKSALPSLTEVGKTRVARNLEKRTSLISTSSSTNFTARVHDPNNYIFDHSSHIFFYWMLNQESVGQCSSPSFIYNITRPGRYLIEVNVVVTLGPHIVTRNRTTTTANTTRVSVLRKLPSATNNKTKIVNHADRIIKNDSKNLTILSDVREWNSVYESDNPDNKTTTTTPPPTPPPPIPPPTPTPTPDSFKCDGHWPGGESDMYKPRKLPFRLFTSLEEVFKDDVPDFLDRFEIKNISKSYYKQNFSTLQMEQQNIAIGTFSTSFLAKDPISFVNVTGKTALTFGEMINLTVQCDGTAYWNYCWEYHEGVYNITGNETCDTPLPLQDKCHFHVGYLLQRSNLYTILVIIDNGVSRAVTPIAINIYKKESHYELFRVLMPVSSLCIAIAFLVFAVGFYIRKRRNYLVEVADFDFIGSTSTDITDDLSDTGICAHVIWAMRKAWLERTQGDDDPFRGNSRYVERPTILDEEDD